jgi:hypothetical protein
VFKVIREAPGFLVKSDDGNPYDAVTLTVEITIETSLKKTPTAGAGEDQEDEETKPRFKDGAITEKYLTRISASNRRVIDFSAGFVATNLTSKNYLISNNTVTQGTSSDLNFGTAVLAHFYLTSRNNLSIGPVLGVTLEEPRRYLLGLSLVYGSRHRIGLSFGLALVM